MCWWVPDVPVHSLASEVQVHEETRVENVSLTVGSCLLMFLTSGAPESGTLPSTQGPQELSPPVLLITGRGSPG